MLFFKNYIMKSKLIVFLIMITPLIIKGQDTIPTKNGSLILHFLGHGTLYLEYEGKVVHIDPWTRVADYSQLPKADYSFITHQHRDHLDKNAIEKINDKKTVIVAPKVCADGLAGLSNIQYLKNGDSREFDFLKVEVVPAYNVVHKRDSGQPFHPKGEGNGYVFSIDGVSVYVAGDTENIPEMKNLKDIDVAFLPMNLPYTMTPEMTADAAKMVNPKILYPYHYGETDTKIIQQLLKSTDIEVRIRDMK